MIDRLTRTHLRDLFERSATDPTVLKKSENETIEYKRSFSFDEKLMKTFAAFANNRGGYIVFGVEDKTRKLLGLEGRQLQKFDHYDLAKITQKLNDFFSPSITVEKITHTISEGSFGVMCVHRCDTKPVIATKNGDSIRDGDIYYSYGAFRQRIKYAELQEIIKDREEKRIKKFFKHMDVIAKIGIDNAAIMDTETGEVLGPTIRRFIINQDLVDELKFVKEGEFRERRGAPTLKLVGRLQTESEDGVIEKPTHISRDDIYKVFLDQRTVENPHEYIRAIAAESVSYTPIYHYAKQAQMNEEGFVHFISGIQSKHPSTVKKLRERIADEKRLGATLTGTNSEAAIKRRKYRKMLVDGTSIPYCSDDARYITSAIRTLSKDELKEDYILGELKTLYDHLNDLSSGEQSNLRQAICYIDYLINPLS